MRVLDRYRVWRRRRKLRNGYLKIAHAELDKTYGFTPLMHAWGAMEDDGYVELDDGEMEWKWP